MLCTGVVLTVGSSGGKIPLCSVWGRGGYLTCTVYRCWYCIQVLSYLVAHLDKIFFVHLGADVGILPVLCAGVVLPDSIALFGWRVGVEIDSLCSVGVRGRYLTCTLCRCCPTCWSTFSRRSLCSAGTRGRYLALFLSPAWLSYRYP